ncbi:MAG TPA: 6-hydroxymethylpterin diphosphokinase MptE-like protein [Polyangiaceae bacterium]|nr:6-hydroxymethylpterin diphosphokinase MptE-like protein [Polyangiaceae bacterium]
MEHEKDLAATTMDGVAPTPARDLSRAFLESNLNRLWLGDRTRERVAAAEARGEVLHQADGTPVLSHRGALLGTPPDDLWLHRTVRESPKGSAYVVFGLGFGHTARALRAMTDAPILIYEPDPGLCRRALEVGPSDLGGFPIVCTSHDLSQLWQTFGGNRDNVTLISTPGYGGLYDREDRDLREAVAQLVQRRFVNDATHRVRAREWVSDVLENVELLAHCPTFLGLAEKYQGVPAFIVGAGPSLGKNAELLADATKKGLVFAVNSSALALASRGITPQIVACMESIDLSELLSKIPYLDHVVRAFSMTAHPKTMRTGSGPLLPIYEALPQFAPLISLGKANGLAVCGSVSTLAFSLAQRLGCSPIVLVGQDLAYTGGQAYAAGTPYEGSRVKLADDGNTLEHEQSAALKATNNTLPRSEPLRSVTAWGGQGTVHSTIGFSAVKSWLELASEVLAYDRPDQRLVNATEGGARVAGFEERTLAEVLAELPERNITPQSIAAAAAEQRPPLSYAELHAWTEKQLQGARAARHAARRVRRLAVSAEHAVSTNDPRGITRAFAKLDSAERGLRAAVSTSPFVDGYSWTAVDAVMQETSGAHDSQRSAENAVRAEASIARCIETCTRELETKLERLLQTFGASAP